MKKIGLAWGATKALILTFLLGIIAGIWLLPPTPSVEISAMDQDKIMWDILDRIDKDGGSVRAARANIIKKPAWNFFKAIDPNMSN